MNIFQSLLCVLNRFVRNSRTMSVPSSVMFCISLVLVLAISQANAQQPSSQTGGEVKKGIMCYVCNSARDPRCGDPFDSSTIEKVDCDQFMPEKNTSVCRKNVQRATLGSKTDYRVIRTCGYLPENPRYGEDEDDNDNTEDRCYNKAGTFEVQVTYCSCYTEGCNPAPRQARSSFSLTSQTGLQIATMIAGSYLMLKDRKGFY